MKKIDLIAVILLLFGGLSWALIGFFEFDLVSEVGIPGGFARVLDCLVGLSTIYIIVRFKRIFKGVLR